MRVRRSAEAEMAPEYRPVRVREEPGGTGRERRARASVAWPVWSASVERVCSVKVRGMGAVRLSQ